MKYLCFVGRGGPSEPGVFTRWSFVTDSYLCAAEHPNMRRVYKYRKDANDGDGGYVLIIKKEEV